MYVTALKLPNFSGRYHFRLCIFASNPEMFFLLGLKSITQDITSLPFIFPDLIGTFQIQINLVLCIVGPDKNDLKLYVRVTLF